jgi:hypothetical protein
MVPSSNIATRSAVPPQDVTIDVQIQTLFNNNRYKDLKRFLAKRQCLNFTNMIFEYMFHVVQTSGILITSIAAGYGIKQMVWFGAGVNALASLIKVFESSNNAMLKKLLNDIKSIRAGTYVDEGALVDDEPPQPPAPSHPPPNVKKMASDISTRV